MIEKKKIIRTGSSPRTIFYSQSQTNGGHGYDYGKPVLQITGHSSRHITQIYSSGYKFLGNKKKTVYPKQKSNRIVNPITSRKRNIFKKPKENFSSLDHSLAVVKNSKQKSLIKTNLKKNATSSEMINILNNNFDNSSNGNSNKKFNSIMKTNYDYKSEILNLPGNFKRNPKEIKDDLDKEDIIKNNKIKTNSTACCFKNKCLYTSKICCLNNSNYEREPQNSLGTEISLNKNNKKSFKNVSDIIYSSNDVFYPNYLNSKNKNELKNNDNFITSYTSDYKFKTLGNNGEEIYLVTNGYKSKKHSNYYNTNFRSKDNHKNKNKIYSLKFNSPYCYINNFNSGKNNDSYYINSHSSIPSYFYNAYNEKNSCKFNNNYITNSHKRKNIEEQKKVFNDVHQQERPVSLRTSYSYNRKNYSQITFG